MTAPKITPVTNKYKIAKGVVLFNQLLNGVYQGYRRIGNCPTVALTVTTASITHDSSEGGLQQTDFDEPSKITRTGKLTCDNLDIENQKLFLSADTSTVTQDTTPVTNYIIDQTNAGFVYQLGESSSNQTGVRGIGSVVVRVKEGDLAASRTNGATYAKGDFYVPATPNAHYYVCTVPGIAAGSPPTFKTDGTTFADGAATFKDLGLIIVPSTADVNYTLDLDLGLISVVAGGAIALATAFVAALAVTGLDGVGLRVDYTPIANTRTRLATSSTSQLNGKMKFIADNPFGENQDFYIPSVAIKPSGDMPFVGTDIAAVTFDLGINKLDSNTAEVYVDGRPQ